MIKDGKILVDDQEDGCFAISFPHDYGDLIQIVLDEEEGYSETAEQLIDEFSARVGLEVMLIGASQKTPGSCIVVHLQTI